MMARDETTDGRGVEVRGDDFDPGWGDNLKAVPPEEDLPFASGDSIVLVSDGTVV